MSTLEKAIGLLQEMPENKLEAVYMYMRFVNSQPDDNKTNPTSNESINSLMGITHKYANPSLEEKETNAFENSVIDKFAHRSTLEKRQHGFQGLLSFAGTLPEDFDYKKELDEAREEKYFLYFEETLFRSRQEETLT